MSTEYKLYRVKMTKQFPNWDEKNGFIYDDIRARSKKEAIKQARRQAEHDWHAGVASGGGLRWFKATEITQ